MLKFGIFEGDGYLRPRIFTKLKKTKK